MRLGVWVQVRVRVRVRVRDSTSQSTVHRKQYNTTMPTTFEQVMPSK